MFIFVVLKIVFSSFSFHFVFTSVKISFYIKYSLIIVGSLIKKIARAFGARIFESYLKMLTRVFDTMM